MNNNYLLILGSQNVNPLDRFYKRDQIHPVQLLNHKDEIIPLTYFDSWGEFGVASLTWDMSNPYIFYISTGNDLYTLNIKNGKKNKIELPDLLDIHEMDIIDSTLWIANTGYDEVIRFNMDKYLIDDRIKLHDLNDNVNVIKDINSDEYSNKYHCNQIFKGFDNSIWVLTHHYKGIQYRHKTINTLIKVHGNGGVVNLDTGEAINLRLRAPHSVRKVGSNYWVFDSRRFSINIYSHKWELLSNIKTSGVGRGATVIDNYFYTGISPMRKRYSSFHTKDNTQQNKIEIFNIKNNEIIETILVSHIEQINNLYSISDMQYHYIIKLSTNNQ